MRVYIPLADGTASNGWEQRFRAGEVPDASPYGLHHLAEHGFDVTFGDQDLGPAAGRIAGSVRYRTHGLELVEAWRGRHLATRRSTDVVLTYDERTAVPAALLGRQRSAAPVVFGTGWLTTRDSAPPLHRHIVDRAIPGAASVWTQCSAMAPLLQSEWSMSDVQFVPVGIDTEFYLEQLWDDAAPTVVGAGEDRFRDHDLLVESVRIARRALPDLRLDLASSLPTTHSADLGTLYPERMGGRMRDLYARSAVVAVALHPTPTGSGLTVILEAMASGRPVVVTDNPGLSDYVIHGETGLLVAPEDPQAFAEAIESLVLDPARAREMGRAAAIRARDLFTSAQMSAALAVLLRAAV